MRRPSTPWRNGRLCNGNDKEITSPQGLLSAAQMNVIEVHTWNGVKSAIGKPDRMTFDLDPARAPERGCRPADDHPE